ncbi:unnamed protein product [Allacma fusca]|uniref:Uncharacterized protein n=1 Tax=Allacma fusca TaxID=39272 RepID=A0A8J2NZP1_9HEXA|nr:unnamed protein product [Allacma fusca]
MCSYIGTVSPGGTPMRQPKKSNPSDPASMIAAALKKRFARMHSPGSEIEQSDSDEDKENAGGKSDSIIIDEFEDTSPEKPDCSVVRNRRNIFETKRFTQTNQKRIIVQHRNSLEQRQVPFDNRVNFPETY